MTRGRQIPIGALVGVVGAILLAVSLFLDWYGELTAWTVFEIIDLLLAAAALVCLLALVERLGVGLPGAPRLGVVPLPLSVVALVLVVSQAVNHPPAAVDLDPETGLWLALAGSALLLLGAILSVARISFALDVSRPGGESRSARAAGSPRTGTGTEASPSRGVRPGEPRPRSVAPPAAGPADPDAPTAARPRERRPPGSEPRG